MFALVEALLYLGEFLLSWRLYVGLALSAAACWLAVSLLPQAAEWPAGLVLGLAGIFLSFWWQIRADSSGKL